MNCLLCNDETARMELDTYSCPECHLVFKNPDSFLDLDEEVKRYSTHQNNSADQGYIDFLNRVVEPLKAFLPKKFSALDFGCGPGPTVCLLLEKIGGQVENYDPNFFPDAHLLIPEFYDVVTCTEVVEHFKTPSQDWDLLVDQVKDGGILAVMTQIYSPAIDYKAWWYKNDPTHVVFYQNETMTYLAARYDLEILYADQKSVTIFKKNY